MKKNSLYIILLAVGALFSACDKYLDIQPVGTVVPSTEADFRALLTSGYTNFPTHKALLNLRTDELLLDEYSTDFPELKDIYLWNDQNPDPVTRAYPWVDFYKSIFYANHILEEMDAKIGVTAETKQIKAEALLLRAYAHFELLNCYADQFSEANKDKKAIPLADHIDLEQRFRPATIAETYALILADIANAQELMQVEDQPAMYKYRFSKRALHAFKSRVHLYREEWEPARQEAAAALAINNKLVDLNQDAALLPSDFESVEAIMALDAVGVSFVSTSSYIAPTLLSSYDQANDKRFTRYFAKSGSNYVSSKGGNDRYNVSFRNGELYLIIAEASLQLNRKQEAVDALGTLLKNRLTASAFSAQELAMATMDRAALLTFVKAERKRELALEGLRWYDLKRGDRPRIVHQIFGQEQVLEQQDPRYIIRYPQEAIDNNPELL